MIGRLHVLTWPLALLMLLSGCGPWKGNSRPLPAWLLRSGSDPSTVRELSHESSTGVDESSSRPLDGPTKDAAQLLARVLDDPQLRDRLDHMLKESPSAERDSSPDASLAQTGLSDSAQVTPEAAPATPPSSGQTGAGRDEGVGVLEQGSETVAAEGRQTKEAEPAAPGHARTVRDSQGPQEESRSDTAPAMRIDANRIDAKRPATPNHRSDELYRERERKVELQAELLRMLQTLAPQTGAGPSQGLSARQVDMMERRLQEMAGSFAASGESPSSLGTESQPQAWDPPADTNLDRTTPPPTDATTAEVNATPVAAGVWKKSLLETRAGLESWLRQERLARRLANSPDRELSGEHVKAELTLRFLHLLAADREQALQPIEGLSQSEQAYWKEQMFAMSELLSTDQVDLESSVFAPNGRRLAIAVQHQRQALGHLSDVAMLQVRNLQLCRSINGFGRFENFSSNSFNSSQELLVYCELENLSMRSFDGGAYQQYESKLKGTISIYDRNRRVIQQVEYETVRDVGRNRRMDFYVHFTFKIPRELETGDYFLQLTIEDLHGGKTAMAPAAVPFRVR